MSRNHDRLGLSVHTGEKRSTSGRCDGGEDVHEIELALPSEHQAFARPKDLGEFVGSRALRGLGRHCTLEGDARPSLGGPYVAQPAGYREADHPQPRGPCRHREVGAEVEGIHGCEGSDDQDRSPRDQESQPHASAGRETDPEPGAQR